MGRDNRQNHWNQSSIRRRSLSVGVVTAAVAGVIAAPVAAYAATESPAVSAVSASAPQSSRGFKVTNLTGHRLRLKAVNGAKFEGRPNVGDVLKPGETHDFEVTYLYAKLNEAVATYEDADGGQPAPQGFSLTLDVDSRNPLAPPQTSSHCVTNKGTESRNTGQCQGSGQNIKLLDSPGTHYDIPSTDPEIQYRTVNLLCASGVGRCDFTNVIESKFYSDKHQVGGALINNTNLPQETTVGFEDTVGSSTSWGTDVEIGVGLEGIVNAKISANYREEWHREHKFSQDVKLTVPAHSKGWVSATTPMVRETGDFTINFGNTSWTIKDVSFEFGDPKKQADFVVDTAPLTEQEQATAPRSFDIPKKIRETTSQKRLAKS
ncbi:hypothetical protein [Streptomyces sp. NPDC058434]|uniref:hypothetical protein n=1 Tax=Streptomyces sp. NPDC058434 TaxID=3346498 RepID=UPI003651E2B1